LSLLLSTIYLPTTDLPPFPTRRSSDLSMEFHMQVNAKHFATAFDFLEAAISEQYYGAISDALATELAKWDDPAVAVTRMPVHEGDRKSTRLNSSHEWISYAVFCLKKKS